MKSIYYDLAMVVLCVGGVFVVRSYGSYIGSILIIWCIIYGLLMSISVYKNK